LGIRKFFRAFYMNALLQNRPDIMGKEQYSGDFCSEKKFWIRLFSVRSEVFTAVTMKNAVFWDVTPYGSCKNRRFGINPSSGLKELAG
jgi:hypothetical protein